MTTIVHKSDFKDFPGLHSACFYWGASVIQYAQNFIVFGYGVNPYENAEKFETKITYSDVIDLSDANNCDTDRIKGMLYRLEISISQAHNMIMNDLCYPEGHINRRFYKCGTPLNK